MPQQSVRRIADTLLSAAHQTSALGRMLDSAGGGNLMIDGSPEGLAEAVTFLFQEVAVLETLVRQLASEVDALGPA